MDESNRIHLVFVFNSDNFLSSDAQKVIEAYKLENNAPTEIVFSRVISQKDLYAHVTGTASPAINIEAPLFNWGQIKEPHVSVYGQMYCAEIATWYTRFGERLFAPNIRSFLGDTEVNQRIRKTLDENPQLFWYFNNGITATCDSFERKPAGGLEFSNFTFQNLRIVNGAQTVGAIYSAFQDSASKGGSETAKVHIKIISLGHADAKLGNEITINTNTQNRVNARDFLALEKLQIRLKTDLAAEGIQYVFKSGESVPDRARGFDLDEAAVALACSLPDHSYAVLAKRNLGVLVSKEKTGKYSEVFTDALESDVLWKKVQALREVDVVLADLRAAQNGRAAQILVHGNRMIAHCTYVSLATNGGDLKSTVTQAAEEMTDFVDKNFPDSYMAVLFKNAEKCGVIANAVIDALKSKPVTSVAIKLKKYKTKGGSS